LAFGQQSTNLRIAADGFRFGPFPGPDALRSGLPGIRRTLLRRGTPSTGQDAGRQNPSRNSKCAAKSSAILRAQMPIEHPPFRGAIIAAQMPESPLIVEIADA